MTLSGTPVVQENANSSLRKINNSPQSEPLRRRRIAASVQGRARQADIFTAPYWPSASKQLWINLVDLEDRTNAAWPACADSTQPVWSFRPEAAQSLVLGDVRDPAEEAGPWTQHKQTSDLCLLYMYKFINLCIFCFL